MGGATWGLFFSPWYWALQGGIETDRNGSGQVDVMERSKKNQWQEG